MTEPSNLLQHFDHHQRIAIEYPDLRKDEFPNLVRFVRPAVERRVTLPRPTQETT
jgi:hypothetical protein